MPRLEGIVNLLAFPFVWIIWDGFTSPVLAALLWIVHLLITYGVYAWFAWPALETTETGNNVKTKGNVKESALGTATIAATKGKIAASTAGRRRRWSNRPEQFYIGEQARTEEPARDALAAWYAQDPDNIMLDDEETSLRSRNIVTAETSQFKGCSGCEDEGCHVNTFDAQDLDSAMRAQEWLFRTYIGSEDNHQRIDALQAQLAEARKNRK